MNPLYTGNMTYWGLPSALVAEHGQAIVAGPPGLYLADLTDGGANDFEQTTSADAPQMYHNAQNRRPALSFDGSRQYMTGAGFGTLFGASAKTLAIAFNVLSVGANGAIIGDAGSKFGVYVQAGPSLVIYHNDGAADTITFTSADGFGLEAWHVLVVTHNGVTLWAMLDTYESLKLTASGATSGGGTMRLGVSGAGDFQECLIGELQAFNAPFNPNGADNSALHQILSYFQSEWLDRGDPLAMAQDVMARRMVNGMRPLSELEILA
jgi:hypothetical protein